MFEAGAPMAPAIFDAGAPIQPAIEAISSSRDGMLDTAYTGPVQTVITHCTAENVKL